MIPEVIMKLAIDATYQGNDGYTIKWAKDSLREIRDYINNILDEKKNE